ncbi:hypothetical protein AB0D08_18810 [Kitasatospora sp. NPDC048540]|nr:hypothetical protein [Kitasatospora sp. MBT63]
MENIVDVDADLATEIELETADTSFTFGEPRSTALDAGTEVEPQGH